MLSTGSRHLGPLMLDVGGTELTAEDREILRHPLVGGVILFARNYVDPQQVRALCAELAALRDPPLLIAVDHEGGRVQRFRVGYTRIPAMASIGALMRESPLLAQREAQQCGEIIGRELNETGIDLCFAPVLDLDYGNSQVIGDRAFGSTPEAVIGLARAFCAGLNGAGLAATGKHFPGHGAVTADSHVELPIDRRPLAAIEADIEPFVALMNEGLESLMMAHVRYRAVDELPASLSTRWIRGYLRQQYRYNGAVFCDDLSMGGAAVVGSMAERALLALDAGCDMLPVCNDRPAAAALIDALAAAKAPAGWSAALSSARLRRLYRSPTPRVLRAAATAPRV